MRKKLIEVALPPDAINKESAREKSTRHVHPPTLDLWWVRRFLVLVEKGGPTPRYLMDRTFGKPDFAETSCTFSLRRFFDLAIMPA